jgi:RNA ligase (TIGR02306 family)
VTTKGAFKTGDLCCYFPIDSVLPAPLEVKLFSESKIQLKNGRIKPIRIRQVFSQGLAVPVGAVLFDTSSTWNGKIYDGLDLTTYLNVTKCIPPQPVSLKNSRIRKQHLCNTNFHQYTNIERIQKFAKWFSAEDIVVAREKIHGTNYRVGYVPTQANTWWKKIKKFFGLLPTHEFCFGSRKLELTFAENLKIMNNNPFVPKNAYERITKRYDFKNILKPGEVIFGEIYGPNIQKNYSYGIKNAELGFVCFDVQINGKYLSDKDLESFCKERNLPLVPKLYEGLFDLNKLLTLTKGNSIMAPTQKVMEGVVIRPINESEDVRGRKIAKLISEEYALKKNNTEFQ